MQGARWLAFGAFLLLVASARWTAAERPAARKAIAVVPHKVPPFAAAQSRALARRGITLTEPAAGVPTLVLFQRPDPTLLDTVRQLARGRRVVAVAAASGSLLQVPDVSAAKMVTDLVAAGASAVIPWHDTQGPARLDRALFGAPAGRRSAITWPGWATAAVSTDFRAVLRQLAWAVEQRPELVVISGPRHAGKLALMEAMVDITQRRERQMYQTATIETEEQLLQLERDAEGVLHRPEEKRPNRRSTGLAMRDVGRLSVAGQKHLAQLIDLSAGPTVVTIDRHGPDAPSAALEPELRQLVEGPAALRVEVPAFEARREDLIPVANALLAEEWGSRHFGGRNDPMPKLSAPAAELVSQLDFPMGLRSLRATMAAAARWLERHETEVGLDLLPLHTMARASSPTTAAALERLADGDRPVTRSTLAGKWQGSDRWRAVLRSIDRATAEPPPLVVLRGPAHAGKRELMEVIAQWLALDRGQATHSSVQRLAPAAQRRLAESLDREATAVVTLDVDERSPQAVALDPALGSQLERGYLIDIPGLDTRREEIGTIAHEMLRTELSPRSTLPERIRDHLKVSPVPTFDPVAVAVLQTLAYPRGIDSLRSIVRGVSGLIAEEVGELLDPWIVNITHQLPREPPPPPPAGVPEQISVDMLRLGNARAID